MRPDFVVIGAKKSGTTSLHSYLGAHPGIAMAEPRELDFFHGPHARDNGLPSRWGKGLSWYESRFDPSAAIRGESSPGYTAFPFVRGVPERMHAVVPEAKLLYLVRDPVERMISLYGQHWGRGFVRRPIDDLFSEPGFEHGRFVASSRYAMQLEQFLERFSASSTLVVAQEDLLRERDRTLARIFRFLGVDPSFRSPAFSDAHNVARDRRLPNAVARWRGWASAGPVVRRFLTAQPVETALSRPMPKHELDPAVRELVAGHVRDDAERLRRLTGQRFEHWSV